LGGFFESGIVNEGSVISIYCLRENLMAILDIVHDALNKVSFLPKEMEEQTVETQEANVPESISLQDLQVLLQIVDLASSRGAFRGPELTQVGAIFDKLNAFLTFISQQQREKAEAEAKASDDSVEE